MVSQPPSLLFLALDQPNQKGPFRNSNPKTRNLPNLFSTDSAGETSLNFGAALPKAKPTKPLKQFYRNKSQNPIPRT
ncbi:hypothetical protein COLO4_38607 [Corchorus olitorius]|uniref:Uncharacterized protein n=1 Tax=Corchorus olitorius TaxID=93759 RepID=A0A1R3FTW2_9ROSI|nr:hypothetical protein COLO4_38607 [Corchorus olitorius]